MFTFRTRTPRLAAIYGMVSVLALASIKLFATPIQFPDRPALSPNGQQLYFSWNGDIWKVPTKGGLAEPITQHPATESDPKVSPDGDRLAFISNRSGSDQVYVADLTSPSLTPTQLTRHTAGYTINDWYPDGESLLVSSNRDDHWRQSARFFKLSAKPTLEAPVKLFNAYGSDGSVSPNGKQLLFNREGYRWWRKGYRGSKSAQIWLYDFDKNTFQKLIHHPTESLWPLWSSDGKSFFYVSGQSGSFNLWKREVESQSDRQITSFTDDSTVYPSLSRDGSTLVFRHLSQFYRINPHSDEPAKRIEIQVPSETRPSDNLLRSLDNAQEVAFSKDGLDVAFISGGDVWIMDTELREPKQVTNTVEEEHSLIFGPKDKSLLFVSLSQGQSDIWKASPADTDRYWWMNDQFNLTQLTHDPEVETNLQLSPTNEWIAYSRKNGDIWIIQPDGKDKKMLYSSVLSPDFDWSPDGKWLVLADSDSDFNRDIWVLPIDGSRSPFNLSRHPDNESTPRWSPDGKLIAFTGRRFDQEIDIYYVWLQAEDNDKSQRDRDLKKAIEKMKKHRKPKKETDSEKQGKPDEGDQKSESNSTQKTSPDSKLPEIKIDFENIHDRIRRVNIPNTQETRLFWSPKSDKLAFSASIDGKRGTYTLSIPEEMKPKLLTEKTGTQAFWIQRDEQIMWLSKGEPGVVLKSGKTESYPFKARQTVSKSKRYLAAFEQAWRLMRDHYYDSNLGNKNWQAVRRKYAPLAKQSTDAQQLSTVIQLMLGELNGSHLGFYPSESTRWKSDNDWSTVTAHLGLRFDDSYNGPGLKVKDLLPNGPADKAGSKVQKGEIILRIDQSPVDRNMDLTGLLNGPIDRFIILRVEATDKTERNVQIRPITYSTARNLLYQKWTDDNREWVHTESDNALGYLHIRAMNWPSFQQFEREIYAAGAGKDGLIIDVRENGGGFTTDHLLTVLTQPDHAITVPRDGSRGYPQDRSVYATWKKPIIVLCNQNSFSNAEIFSHAIKHLKRGQLVGVPTAGGVISTGSAQVMDIGRIRMPFRGWYLAGSGEDMELHGAVPHFIVWPKPGEIPSGIDSQLNKAIEILQKEVTEWRAKPIIELKKASERRLAE